VVVVVVDIWIWDQRVEVVGDREIKILMLLLISFIRFSFFFLKKYLI